MWYNIVNVYVCYICIAYDQYGFWTKSYKQSVVIDFITKLKENIDEKKIAIGIFIDLKRAFDAVNY